MVLWPFHWQWLTKNLMPLTCHPQRNSTSLTQTQLDHDVKSFHVSDPSLCKCMVTSPQLQDTVHWKEDTTSGLNQACVLNSVDRRDLPHQISRHACFHCTASCESVELLWGCPIPQRMSLPFGASALSNTLMDYWSASYHQGNKKQCQLLNWLPVQTSRNLEYMRYFGLQWNEYSSQHRKIGIPLTMFGAQETPKKTCHKLIVTLHLSVRTWSICRCATLWYFHQAAEHLEHFTLEVPSLIRVYGEGHPKPHHISFKESLAITSASCLQQNHLKKPGELVNHHQNILMSSGSLTKWIQHIQMHPIVWVPSLIWLQWGPWVRFLPLVTTASITCCHVDFNIHRHPIPIHLLLHPLHCLILSHMSSDQGVMIHHQHFLLQLLQDDKQITCVGCLLPYIKQHSINQLQLSPMTSHLSCSRTWQMYFGLCGITLSIQPPKQWSQIRILHLYVS